MSLILLALLWTAYCFLHSFLISIGFNELLKSRFGSLRFYRLIYVIFSIITIVPVFVFEGQIDAREVILWSGYFVYLKYTLIIYGVTLFLLSSSSYDLLNFLGVRQIVQQKEFDTLSNNEFAAKGVHRFVRHPWYAALLALLWARDLNSATLTTTICLTCYLFIGTRLEEKKLTITFGEKYKDYQSRVSMLFPIRWVKKRLFNK